MHHQRLDLPLQDLHAGGGDHRADVGHHDLAEDVANEPVVPLEARRCRVLHGKAVVVVWPEAVNDPLAPRRSTDSLNIDLLISYRYTKIYCIDRQERSFKQRDRQMVFLTSYNGPSGSSAGWMLM